MTSLVVQLFPAVIVFLLLMLATGLLIITRRISRRGRRSPLTSDLLRNPGESLREQVEELSSDLISNLLFFILILCLIAIQFLLQERTDPQANTMSLMITYGLISVGGVLFFIFQEVRIFRKRQLLRLGLECELAVGQQLNQLMLLGCRVYHDFPAEGFNIDHIVIGPAGVYAVETKGRAKPDKGGGTEEALVVYDGKGLQFPGWSETKPIAQAKRQAQWLENWLKSAVGESVTVLPALALPGWYIDRKARNMAVFNAKNPDFLAKGNGEVKLTEAMIQRVAHQVELRCRTVEPVSYGKKKGK
ncbi:MAG: nuclease-related domain-containing protein [Desulfurivibrionaceae bacterium]